MNQHNIKILLEKYFEGETNLQEEAQLTQYFQQENILEDLSAYSPIFKFYQHQKKIKFPDAIHQNTSQPEMKKSAVSTS